MNLFLISIFSKIKMEKTKKYNLNMIILQYLNNVNNNDCNELLINVYILNDY